MTQSNMIRVSALLWVLVGAAGTSAQQSESQQKCIDALNAGAAKMGAIQGKENLACLKGAATGKLSGSAQACLSADAKGRVAAQQRKLDDAEATKCAAAPTIAFTSAATAGSSAQVGRRNVFGDLFGSNLDAGVVACSESTDGCKCQQGVAKAAEKLALAKWKMFVACKKESLAAGAATVADVEKCVADELTPGSLAADSDQKLAKLVTKLSDKVAKACDAAGVTGTAFAAGTCSGMSGATLAACIDQQVECRVCQTINDVDDLNANCDVFDDGSANASCGCSPLSTAACDDGVSCTIADACGDGVCAGTAIAPNRAAAITRQEVSTDGLDVSHLSVEIVTLTDDPFQLAATDLTQFPAGFDLDSLSTTSCTLEASPNGPRYRCRHAIELVATSACEGDGDYQLSLQYSCTPAVSGCSLCGVTDTIDFTLDTENFCS